MVISAFSQAMYKLSQDKKALKLGNNCSHVLTTTCVELMALPVTCNVVGSALYDVVLNKLISA